MSSISSWFDANNVELVRFFDQIGCHDQKTKNTICELVAQRFLGQGEETQSVSDSLTVHTLESRFSLLTIDRVNQYFSHFCLDSKYVAVIVRAFMKHIFAPLFHKPYLLQPLTSWIISNGPYLSLGELLADSFKLDMQDASHYFKNFLPEDQLEFKSVLAKDGNLDYLQNVLCPFLAEINDYDSRKFHKARQKYPQEPSQEGKKVVIVTERNGGAHMAQCEAMKVHLVGLGFIVEVIEFQVIAKEFDPLFKNQVKLADGTDATETEIYNKLLAQKKEIIQARLLQTYSLFLSTRYPQLYPKDALKAVIKKIQKFQPNIIVCNLPYNDHFYSLPFRLNCPMEIVHCDYDFHQNCVNVYNRQKSLPESARLVGFGMPIMDPAIFPAAIPPNDPSIHIVGFPTREAFTPITDPQTLLQLRLKYNLRPNEVTISISRGLLGALEHLKECVDDLLQSKEAPLPMQIIVICGENRESKAFLEEYTKKYPTQEHPFTFHIKGLMNQQEMNEIFQLSDISDIKAGGGTCQEFLVSIGSRGSIRRALVTAAYEWENCNADFLERTGLAKKYDRERSDKLSLIKQLISSRQLLPAPLVNWKIALPLILKEKMRRHDQFE